MNKYAASTSLPRRREKARLIERDAEAPRPTVPVWEELEESVNLLRCAVERLLNSLIALERLRDLRLENLIDLPPLRRRRARPGCCDLLEVDRVVRVDLDELLRQVLQHRHLAGTRHLILRPSAQHEPCERRGSRLVLGRLRDHDVLAADDTDAATRACGNRRPCELHRPAEDREHPRPVERRDVLVLADPVVRPEAAVASQNDV